METNDSDKNNPPLCVRCGDLPEEIHDREWAYDCSCYSTGMYEEREAARGAWSKCQSNRRKRQNAIANASPLWLQSQDD